MNQVFDPVRFLRLLRAHWAESWKGYAWFVGISAIVNGIFLAIALQADSRHQYSQLQQSQQAGWYLVGLVVTGLVFATRYFEKFSSTGSTLILLMRPASIFEKWCLALLFACIVFPLVYTVVYVCMNYPAVAYASSHYLALPQPPDPLPVFRIYIPFLWPNTDALADDGNGTTHLIELVLALKLFAFFAVCMNGRVFFKRAAVLKTWLTVFGLLLLGYCINLKGFDDLFAADLYWVFPDSPRPISDPWDAVPLYTIFFGVPILVWIALFFHLKEREVS